MCTDQAAAPGIRSASTSHPDICHRGDVVYRQALARGTVPAAGAPECLLALRLLRPLPDGPETLVPVPPDIAAALLTRPIEQTIRHQEGALRSLRSALTRAESAYRQIGDDRAIGLIVGEDAVSIALGKAALSCRVDVATAQPGAGQPEDVLAEALPHHLDLCDRGVRNRLLYQHTVRSHSPTLAYIDKISAAGSEIRTVAEVFDRLVVFDGKVAFVFTERGGQTAALSVRQPDLVRHLARVFDCAWDRAEPIAPEMNQWRPPLFGAQTQATILRLMVEGHTDKAIASRLGLSTRTVAAHIKRAADRLHSSSRAQLGYLLGQSGLLHSQDAHAQPGHA